MNISREDIKWVKRVLMPFAGVRKLILGWSNSKKVYPDIWCVPSSGVPKIVVTQEWARQDTAERRKRLTHELIGHVKLDWEHNSYMDKVGFSTYPNKDRVSPVIYHDIIKGRLKSSRSYIEGGINGVVSS